MDAIVCPDAPIVVGFSLGVLTVLIVQEGDHLVQHRFSNRKARAKGRACKVESEVSTDSVFRNKILEAPSGARIRIIVKIHPFIDLFINRIAHGSRKLLLGHVWTASPWQELSDLLQDWSGAVMCPACLCGGEAAGHNALRGSGPNQKLAFKMR